MTTSGGGGGGDFFAAAAIVPTAFFLTGTGCQWRAIPKDLPPRSTVHDYFDLWAWDGTLDRIHHAL
jgi:transposase